MAKLTNPTKKQQRAMLDRRWSAFIRTHGQCEQCGTKTQLTNSHIIGRNNIKVQFDPRNTQCICAPCHAHFTINPLKHADFVRTSTCAQYENVMLLQSQNTMIKPDYEVWNKIYEIVTQKHMTLEQTRKWLGNRIIHRIEHIPEL